MFQMRVERAVEIASDANKDRLMPDEVEAFCPIKATPAALMKDHILVIPGSDSLEDFYKFNLRVFQWDDVDTIWDQIRSEDDMGGVYWHQGFSRYADALEGWLRGLDAEVEFIIGHSLGAAVAQVLSFRYEIPMIGFAPPRPMFDNGATAENPIALLIARDDDPVRELPPRFLHVGDYRELAHLDGRRLPAHGMRHYRRTIQAYLENGTLPHVWPAV